MVCSLVNHIFQGSKNLKFWCTIFRAPCADFWCTRAPQKKLAPLQYFSISCASYCSSYRQDFKFIRRQVSYDLMYLNLLWPTFYVVLTIYFRMCECESQNVCSQSILAKVCARVFVKILNMATICFPQQSRHWNNAQQIHWN